MKTKILLVIMICLFLSGCSATYDIEIVKNTVKENTQIVNNNKSTWDIYLDDNTPIDGDIDETDIKRFTYREYIEDLLSQKNLAILGSDNSYYKQKKVSNNSSLGIKYSYEYSFNDYKNSSIANQCFKYFKAFTDSNINYISTSNGFNCFNYEDLEDVTIHIKTNHKVIKTNADEVDGYNYYWYITKSNASNKSIYVEMYKDKFIFNYNNSVTKVVIGIISVAFLGFIVIIFLNRKIKKNNSI